MMWFVIQSINEMFRWAWMFIVRAIQTAFVRAATSVPIWVCIFAESSWPRWITMKTDSASEKMVMARKGRVCPPSSSSRSRRLWTSPRPARPAVPQVAGESSKASTAPQAASRRHRVAGSGVGIALPPKPFGQRSGRPLCTGACWCWIRSPGYSLLGQESMEF